MALLKKFNFVGGRVLKTGIAVFITALICDLLGWPPMRAFSSALGRR
ncbi:aromatic acid exporter family protein [Mesobacillus sp. AQ2]|nr:aromatic acid exporter family protein [Mesobacillus sp. AQ2]WHX41367.1 aromatic acid exporter family protein [Mesobacillus sp. AQ2]